MPEGTALCCYTHDHIIYASLPGETTSFFNHFISPMLKQKAENELPGGKSCLKKTPAHRNFRQNMYTEKFLCIVWSVQSAQPVKCSICFLGLFCRLWQNVWYWTTHQLEASHQQRKNNRKYTEDFPFYGLWVAVFTSFGHNLSGGARFSQISL